MNRRNFIKAGLAFLAAPVAVANALPSKTVAVEPPVVEGPEPDFDAFVKQMTKEIAAGLNVPYEMLYAAA